MNSCVLASRLRLLWLGFTCLLATITGLRAAPPPITVNELTVTVAPFETGAFSFAGGALAIVPNGTWFVGVDLYRNTLIALPRLGHRGWVPVARVVAGDSGITSVEQIAPVLPATRIPRTLEKIRNAQPVNVVVMGSSLAEGGGTTTWSGMLFNASSSLSAYKVPHMGTFQNIGLGGSPNQYMLAQLGYALPDGRSSLFNNVDLVALTCLANGGEYRLSNIEPLVRQLRTRGVEVVLLTDNPQNPSNAYASMQTSALYSDGTEPIRVADLYGIELADTAAYVFEQHLRYGSGIYSDAIHMRGAEPAGPSVAQPSCGHEVYARAVRSVIPFTSQFIGTPVSNFTFDDGPQGFTSYSAASVAAADGKLKVAKTTGNTSQWGGWVTIPAVKNGDVLRVQGTWSFEDGYSGNNISIGTQGGGSGWGSSVRSSAPGTFDVTVTVSRDILSGGRLLFFGNNDAAPLNASFSIDNIIITLNPATVAADMLPGRTEAVTPIPSARIVTDLKTPDDAIIILPKDETYLASDHAARGSLGAHPRGAGSFARRFFAGTGATEDLLTLTTGQKAIIPAASAVGFSIIRYAGSADATVTLEVRRNATLLKTINLGAGYNREGYDAILTPTQYGQLAPIENGDIELSVTAGTLKICALVVLTTDIDLLTPQTLTFPAIADRVFDPANNTIHLSAISSANLMPITFSVISGPATINGNTLTITRAGSITVEATQAGDATYAAAIATQSFVVTYAPPASYTEWAAQHELTDPVSDPDNDGLSNLMEYALATDPKSPETTPATHVERGQTSLGLRYRKSRSDLIYEVETTTNLSLPATWTAIGVNQGLPDEESEVTATVPINEEPARFLRLKVTLNL